MHWHDLARVQGGAISGDQLLDGGLTVPRIRVLLERGDLREILPSAARSDDGHQWATDHDQRAHPIAIEVDGKLGHDAKSPRFEDDRLRHESARCRGLAGAQVHLGPPEASPGWGPRRHS
jgi:hypothetical protein